jgi:hypothetical protein
VIGYRIADWDTPLRVGPNRSAGRFNRASSEPTQYLCEHPLGPWAEYLRREERRTHEQVIALRMRVWVVRLAEEEVFALTFDNAVDHGLSAEQLVSSDWHACQQLGDRWRSDRAAPKMFTTPSAALPGTRNLVILGPLVGQAYELEIIDPEVDAAVAVTAEDGHAPRDLVDHVRYGDEPHPELQAWSSAGTFIPSVGVLTDSKYAIGSETA